MRHASQNRKILVIDDNPEALEFVQAALEQKEYQVITAASGESALKYYKSKEPDLILLDVMMAGMNGWEVLKRIKSSETSNLEIQHTPVIMLTAKVDTQSKIRALGSGADDYLTKPFRMDELLARVRSQLRIKGLMERLEKISLTDEMTGLPNHRHFRQKWEAEIKNRNAKNPLSIFMTDLDHFKQYNDQEGHLAGDQLLKEIGNFLLSWKKKDEFTARYAGEEFVILLPGLSKSKMKERAFDLCSKIPLNIQKKIPNLKKNITASIGAAHFPEDVEDPKRILALADIALYQSKRLGRNRISLLTKKKFFLSGHEKEKSVALMGDFNFWSIDRHAAIKKSEGWEVKATLPIGENQYAWLLNGEKIIPDPQNDRQTKNQDGETISILNVLKAD